jgi:hypothetical protein
MFKVHCSSILVMTSKVFGLVVVPLSILLPLLIGILKYKQLSFSAKMIHWYLIVSAIFTGISLLISRHYHQNSMPVSHLFTLIELVMITLFYKSLFGAGNKNNTYNYIILVFAVVCVMNALFFQSIYTYNSYTKSIEAIICILFAMKYFAAIASGSSSIKIITAPDFYFNSGLFLYFSGAFMLFVFSNFIVTKLSLNDFFIIWTIHSSLVLLMYLFFSTALLLCKK